MGKNSGRRKTFKLLIEGEAFAATRTIWGKLLMTMKMAFAADHPDYEEDNGNFSLFIEISIAYLGVGTWVRTDIYSCICLLICFWYKCAIYVRYVI